MTYALRCGSVPLLVSKNSELYSRRTVYGAKQSLSPFITPVEVRKREAPGLSNLGTSSENRSHASDDGGEEKCSVRRASFGETSRTMPRHIRVFLAFCGAKFESQLRKCTENNKRNRPKLGRTAQKFFLCGVTIQFTT